RIYAFGGYDAGFAASAAAEVYDPATDTWEAMDPMPVPVVNSFCAAIGDKIYVFGGMSDGAMWPGDQGNILRSIVEFNPAEAPGRQWTYKGSVPISILDNGGWYGGSAAAVGESLYFVAYPF